MMVIIDKDHQRIDPSKLFPVPKQVPAIVREVELHYPEVVKFQKANEVFIGNTPLVEILQVAGYPETPNFQQETFFIEGRYYEITQAGRDAGGGNIIQIDGVWYLAKKAYDNNNVFIGWTPIKALPLNVAQASGFVRVVEVPTPIPTATNAPVPTRVPETDNNAETTQGSGSNQYGNSLTLEENVVGFFKEDVPKAFNNPKSPIEKFGNEMDSFIEFISDKNNLIIIFLLIVLFIAVKSIINRTKEF